MIAGQKFCADEEVIAETEAYFEAEDKSCYKNGIEKLYGRYYRCTALEGNYIENNKIKFYQKNIFFPMLACELFSPPPGMFTEMQNKVKFRLAHWRTVHLRIAHFALRGGRRIPRVPETYGFEIPCKILGTPTINGYHYWCCFIYKSKSFHLRLRAVRVSILI
ncbi:hypothetical protein TNCV_4930401 [Trichonephila clavipes]|nr:hypothetical protein TNCV_4930401 [Trichonephila clavipes]